VLAPLRHVARFLRLALVCLALVWSSAPAAAAPITDAVTLVAVSREALAEKAGPAAPSKAAGHAPAAAARVPGRERLAARLRAARAPGPPRRLYLEHRALLC